MNTKNNKRAKDTDEALIRAFFSAFQKKGSVGRVTVREICDEAGVNRSTFYAHYVDVFDLMERVERHMAESLTDSFLSQMEKGDIGACFESLFAFVKEYREFYQLYFNRSAGNTNLSVIQLARETYMDRLEELSWRKLGFASPEEMGYHEDFYLAGMSAMLRRWVNSGCKESPREMCEILGRQYNPNRELFEWK